MVMTLITEAVKNYGSITTSEKTHKENPKLRVYKQRWYIAVVFALFVLGQGNVGNTWGPISSTAEKVYGWDDSTIPLLGVGGSLVFLLAFLPMVKALMRFGMRPMLLICTFLMVLGTGLRCLHLPPIFISSFAYLSAVFNGVAGTLAMIGPTSISCSWFAPNQRTIATGGMNAMGNNFPSFLLAKLLVADYNTSSPLLVSTALNASYNMSDLIAIDERIMLFDVRDLMLVYFLFCLTIFVAVVLYFPSKPLLPPSASAAAPRVEFKKGLQMIFRTKNFWLLAIPYACCMSMQNAFVSVISMVLEPFGIQQENADWMGLTASISGFISAVSTGYVVDHLRCGLKLPLIFVITGAGIGYGWLALMALQVFPVHLGHVLASLITGAIFCNAAGPIFLELGCDLAYPVSEEVTAGVLASANNLIGVIFLLTMFFCDGRKSWISVSVAVSFLASVPLLLIMKEIRPRLALDQKKVSSEEC